MVIENSYRQIISRFTTDNGTLIDHLYTDLIEKEIYAGILRHTLAIIKQYGLLLNQRGSKYILKG